MKKVVVLLSSYNGEKFIEEQIKSILDQSYRDITLVIRDDGSSDNTCGIIERLQKEDKRIVLYKEENIGVKASFLSLIKKPMNADYYAFCDQDDIWDVDKIEIAVNMLNECKNDLPIMYYSNIRLIDKEGSVIGRLISEKYEGQTKYQVLVDNMAAGCSIVFNSKAKEIIDDWDLKYLPMHDLLVNIICSFFGYVVYDKSMHMSYRQHDENVVGADSNISFRKLKKKIRRLFSNEEQPRYMMAMEFYEKFASKFSENEREKIERIINYKKSLRNKTSLLFDTEICSVNFFKDLRYRLLIVLGRI